MYKVFIILICIAICPFYSCNRYDLHSEEQIKTEQIKTPTEVEGVYEFVSETISLIEPINSIEKRTNKEWKGLWIFKEGYFSRNMMKIDRSNWTPSHFPSNHIELGFDAVSGKFQINEDKKIELNKNIMLYPRNNLTDEFYSYEFNFNQLILTQELLPNRHTTSKGKKVIVLQKINNYKKEIDVNTKIL